MSVGEGGGGVCCEQVSGKVLMLCWFLQVSVSGLGFVGGLWGMVPTSNLFPRELTVLPTYTMRFNKSPFHISQVFFKLLLL